MKLIYDEEYTHTFHSPGIEPWITGFLKGKPSLGRVLDVGYGLGFTRMLLKITKVLEKEYMLAFKQVVS